jgi:LysR family transcriptional regulator for bpeEF and oprC
MDRLNALQLFVRVAEAGSLTKAAAVLGIGQPAVSKQMAALEKRLGAQLINRTARGLSLTAAGQDYYESAVRLLQEFEDAEDRVGRRQASPAGLSAWPHRRAWDGCTCFPSLRGSSLAIPR